jgi:hypothetical protein
MKKIILSLSIFVLFFSTKIAFAGLIINEVMYDPIDGSDYEWIEIFNNSNEQINLDGWRFFNSQSSSAPLRTSGSFVLEPNSFALITSNTSLISFSGQIFTSSQFSLPNDSSKYGTYKGVYSDSNKTAGDSITYNTQLGANGDGNSLQLINNAWASAVPTMGIQNEVITDGNNENPVVFNNDNNTNNVSNGGGTVLGTKNIETKTTKVTEVPSIKAKILANNITFTGQPFLIKTNVFGYKNEDLVLGRAYWNFGDGSSYEQINNFEKFNHIYDYPGEYVLMLEYYLNSISKIPDVVNKMTIKVLPTTVVISKIGDDKDFFIELTNNATSDIDISNWVIKAFGKIFILPKNSIILSKKQMTISGKITGFKLADQYDLKLFSASNELIFDFSNKYLPTKDIIIDKVVQNKNESSIKIENKTATSVEVDLTSVGDIKPGNNDLSASPILSDVSTVNEKRSYFFFWIFVVLLLVSGGLTYYIRGRNNVSKVRDDFKIIDE